MKSLWVLGNIMGISVFVGYILMNVSLVYSLISFLISVIAGNLFIYELIKYANNKFDEMLNKAKNGITSFFDVMENPKLDNDEIIEDMNDEEMGVLR